MPEIGDTIELDVNGGVITSTGGGIYLGGGASMSLKAVIVEDRGDSWRVRLSLGSPDLEFIEVPK